MENRSLYLCRHGQRIDAIRPKWYSTEDNRHDPHLSEQGMRQVQLLAKRLQAEAIDHIFVSPYIRALQTAAPIAESLQQPVMVEPGIGEWQSRYLVSSAVELPTAHQRGEEFPMIDTRYTPFILPVFPESEKDVRERLLRTVTHLLEQYDGNLLLVGHGKVVSGVSTQLTGKPENTFRHDVACLTQLVYEGGKWYVRINGDTSHLNPDVQWV